MPKIKQRSTPEIRQLATGVTDETHKSDMMVTAIISGSLAGASCLFSALNAIRHDSETAIQLLGVGGVFATAGVARIAVDQFSRLKRTREYIKQNYAVPQVQKKQARNEQLTESLRQM